MSNVLESTKELLGIPTDVDVFDSQLVMYINSALVTLQAIGFKTDVYQITSDSGDLEEYIPEDEAIRSMVQMYIFMKVRQSFDPPQTSAVLTALQASISEYEWRLSNYSEG